MGSRLILVFQTFEAGDKDASVLGESASTKRLEFAAIKFAVAVAEDVVSDETAYEDD